MTSSSSTVHRPPPELRVGAVPRCRVARRASRRRRVGSSAPVGRGRQESPRRRRRSSPDRRCAGFVGRTWPVGRRGAECPRRRRGGRWSPAARRVGPEGRRAGGRWGSCRAWFFSCREKYGWRIGRLQKVSAIATCHVTSYDVVVIKTFADRETQLLYTDGRSRRLPPDIIRRALRKLDYIHLASRLEDLRVPPGNRLHALVGDRAGQHLISINSQWRICFRFQEGDAYEVEITDYH